MKILTFGVSLNLFYTIYQITNLVNGKIYIGKHETKNPNDDYMGSGKIIRQAIEKYGIESFSKDILYVFETEEEMNSKEAELVTEEFVKLESNYNLCPGGQGGFGFININNLNSNRIIKKNYEYLIRAKKIFLEKMKNEQFNIIFREKIKKTHKKTKTFLGKKHSDETKQKMSLSMKTKQIGEKNSQFGTIWISDGIINKKIKKDDPIPDGFHRGRK